MYDATAFSRAVLSRRSSPVSEDIGQPLLSAGSQYLMVGNLSTPQSCIEPVRLGDLRPPLQIALRLRRFRRAIVCCESHDGVLKNCSELRVTVGKSDLATIRLLTEPWPENLPMPSNRHPVVAPRTWYKLFVRLRSRK
jgi:hypothetical protein